MKTAAVGSVLMIVLVLVWMVRLVSEGRAGTPAGAGGRGPVDAGKYFDPASPTSGLQEAIDATGPDGGIVLIPPGVYSLRRPLVMKSRVTLRGSGASTVLRKEAGFASPLTADLPVGATVVEVKDASGFRVGSEIGIRDPERLGWNCHHAIVKAVEGKRVRFDPPTVRDYSVERGALAFGFHPAIYARGQSEFSIESLRIDGNPAAQAAEVPVDFTFAAIHLVKCSAARVRDVWVSGWPSDGIGVQGGSDMQVIGCTVVKCRGHGFHPGTSLKHAVFTGNVGRDNGWDGLFFCMRVRHCTVSNNVFHGNGWSGIGGLGDAYDEWNVCSGNTCTDNGRAGILISNGKNNTVVGNVCVNNSRSRAGEYPGILIHDTTGTLVADNRCCDDQQQPTQLVGISESGNSDRNLISNNHLAGSKTPLEKVGPNTQATGNLQ